MKFTFRYGSGVLTLPKETLNLLNSASGEDLRVLLLLAGNPDAEYDDKLLAKAAGCSVARVRRAVDFFADAGVLSRTEPDSKTGTAPKATSAPNKSGMVAAPDCVGNPCPDTAETQAETQDPPSTKPLRRAEQLPDYTTTELAALLEKRKDLALLLEECQRAWGKVFNTHEANIVIGLIEYLGFDGEYILLLLNHCAKMNVRSLHSAERLAYRMHDEGTVTVDALREKLCRMEAAHGAEGMIRSMFGLGSRSLTDKEKEQIDLWINSYRFGEDVIRRAYEITVNVKSKPSVNYAGGILKRWHEAGLDTVEKIEKTEAERQEQNQKNVLDAATLAQPGDSFWEAAVRASYGKDFGILGLGKQDGDGKDHKNSMSEKGDKDGTNGDR